MAGGFLFQDDISDSGHTKTLAAKRLNRLPLGKNMGFVTDDDSLSCSWRRSPLAGNDHERDEASFLADRTTNGGMCRFFFRFFFERILCFLSLQRCIESQFPANLIQPLPVSGRHQTIVAHLVKTRRKNMLQETTHKLLSGKRHDFPLLLLRILVAKCHHALLRGKNPAVGDGRLMDVPGKIIQNIIGSARPRFTVNNPGYIPD